MESDQSRNAEESLKKSMDPDDPQADHFQRLTVPFLSTDASLVKCFTSSCQQTNMSSLAEIISSATNTAIKITYNVRHFQ